MKKTVYSADVEKLLGDDLFLLWCIIPDAIENCWWFEWIKGNPEKAAALEEAKLIVLSLRINNYRLTDGEISDMKSRLSKRLKKKRALVRYWYFTAAVLLLLFSISLYYVDFTEDPHILHTNSEDVNPIVIDDSQTEIEFFVQNKEKYLLPNEAQIKLQPTGEIELNKAAGETIEDQKTIATPDISINSHLNTLKVPYGRRSSLTFSDGTKAWVNAGTVLVFPTIFSEKERVIEVSGEIYLEVSKHSSSPFVVKTSQIDVTVLGTSFNVTAYPEDIDQSVVLVSGKVSVKHGSNPSIVLSPNERVVLTDNNTVVSHVNVRNYTSWKEGILQFENEKLSYILNSLSRYYRLSFEADQDVREFVCSGKLVLFNDVVQVMSTLEKSFPITCGLDGNMVRLSKRTEKKNAYVKK